MEMIRSDCGKIIDGLAIYGVCGKLKDAILAHLFDLA